MGLFRRAAAGRVFSVSATGERTHLPGDRVVAAWGDGRALTIGFSRHPSSRGGVALTTGFGGREGDHPAIAIHPGASNVMLVGIGAAGEASLLVGAGEARTPTDAGSLVLDLGGGRDLTVTRGALVRLEAGPGMTADDAKTLMGGGRVSSSDLVVRFGAANVVHVVVDRRTVVLAGPAVPKGP